MTMNRCVFILAIGLLSGCAELDDQGSSRWSITSGACSSVTLVAPTAGFTSPAGTPVPLTASATCSSGVPEFEFWFKNVGDQNWQVIRDDGTLVQATSWNILANYVPSGGSSSSFAPSAPGDVCFSAVARAQGSTVTFEGRSGALCGRVTIGSAPIRTRVIAPSPSYTTPFAILDVVAGSGNVTTNLDGYFDAGDRIRAVRMFVTDNPQPGPAPGYSGPTLLVGALRAFTPAGGVIPSMLGTSSPSDGSGTVQTLSINGMDEPITAGGRTHSVQLIDFAGVAPTVVWSIEVDYVPAN